MQGSGNNTAEAILKMDPVNLREKLHDMHQNMEVMEKRISRVTKSAKNLQKAYAALHVATTEFQETLIPFADGQEDSIMMSFSKTLQKVGESESNLGERLTPIIVNTLNGFVEKEIKVGLELHGKMVRLRDAYDSAAAKARKKNRQTEEVEEKKREFEAANAKYVQKLIDVETKKEFELMDIFTNWMVCSLTHHKRAYKLLDELQPLIKQYKKKMFKDAKGYTAEEDKRLDAVKTSLANNEKGTESEIQGYLTNLSVIGRPKRWWAVANGMLAQYRNYSDFSPTESYDLLLFSVKPVPDDPCSFCLVSPSDNFSLQTSSPEERQQWIVAISSSISNQLNSQSSAHSDTSKTITTDPSHPLQQLRRGNKSFQFCVDCGAKDPDWGAINLGVMFCIHCSGIHRNLGVHISQVRSLTLDVEVWDEDLIRMMKGIGNEVANSIWEECYDAESIPRITSASDMKAREIFIVIKYKEKRFLRPYPHSLLQLCSGDEPPSVKDVLHCLLCTNNVDMKNEQGQTALHLLSASHDSLISLELLLRNGASPNIQDNKGDTPLHVAYRAGNIKAGSCLSKHGASGETANHSGEVASALKKHGFIEAIPRQKSRVSGSNFEIGIGEQRKLSRSSASNLNVDLGDDKKLSPPAISPRTRTWTSSKTPSVSAQLVVAGNTNSSRMSVGGTPTHTQSSPPPVHKSAMPAHQPSAPLPALPTTPKSPPKSRSVAQLPQARQRPSSPEPQQKILPPSKKLPQPPSK